MHHHKDNTVAVMLTLVEVPQDNIRTVFMKKLTTY